MQLNISNTGAVKALLKYLDEADIKGKEAIAFITLIKWVKDLDNIFLKLDKQKKEIEELKSQIDKLSIPKPAKVKKSKEET